MRLLFTGAYADGVVLAGGLVALTLAVVAPWLGARNFKPPNRRTAGPLSRLTGYGDSSSYT
jgi:hypothetical protein